MTAAEKIKEMGIVPVVVLEDAMDAKPLAKALCEGGLPCAEVTFRTAAAKESIRIMLEEYPETVVSLKKIPGYIREEKEELVLGAGTTLSEIAQSDAVKAYAQALAQAAYSVASPLIRNTATLGGNVCQDVRCWYYRYPDSIGGRLNCKRKGGASYGRCAVRDGLPPLLEKLADADGIIFGSPIYFMGVSGALRALLERLLFPFIVYDAAYSSLAPKRMPTAFVYTMNITETDMAGFKLPALLSPMETFVARIFSGPEILSVCNTVQFDDYSKYMAERFSETDKKRHREEHFPEVLRHAFAMGVRMAERAGLPE